ncbi:hypothetical protein L1987_45284 [Smallanthus sonchifolius]|uniref:Uncharacterized protein n=1 Tax=Smallanthus sonchifolius TaxID=185202 RepID=A0ACB9GSU6_9ASTR|nr:hypothetical protein L1987_45284 [Smallanthus sonchifolius]
MIAGKAGWMGPTYSTSTAYATSNFCILNAANHIIGGDAVSLVFMAILLCITIFIVLKILQDMMLCGGSESSILPLGLSNKFHLILKIKMKTCAEIGGFVACKALSERNNDSPKASRPWDSVSVYISSIIQLFMQFILYEQGRDGFVMGEGAGVLLLEELSMLKYVFSVLLK